MPLFESVRPSIINPYFNRRKARHCICQGLGLGFSDSVFVRREWCPEIRTNDQLELADLEGKTVVMFHDVGHSFYELADDVSHALRKRSQGVVVVSAHAHGFNDYELLAQEPGVIAIWLTEHAPPPSHHEKIHHIRELSRVH